MKENYFWMYCLLILSCISALSVEKGHAQTKGVFYPISSKFSYSIPGNTQNYLMQTGANLPQFSMADINNDGKLDLFVYDKHAQKPLVYLFVDPDSFVHIPAYEAILPLLSDWALFVDYNKDGKPDLWTRNEENNGVMLYKNTTRSTDNYIHFELVTEALRYYNFNSVIDTSNLFCDRNNIPAIVDFDNDGDIDFLTLQSTGLGVSLFLNNCIENNKSLEDISFEGPDDCWGDFSESATTNDIFLKRYPFCRKSFYRYKKHAGGSALLLFDKDGDGDNDLLLGNAGYGDLLYLENGRKNHNLKRDSFINAFKDFPALNPAKVKEYAASYLLKLYNNQKEYLIVSSAEGDDRTFNIEQSGKLMCYKNISTSSAFDFQLDSTHFINNAFKNQGAFSSPTYGDVDNDGINDFLIGSNGNQSITGGLTDKIAFYKGINDSNWNFELVDLDFLSLSIDSLQNSSISLADLDGDGKPELIIGTSSSIIKCYKNNSNAGIISFASSNYLSNLYFIFSNGAVHVVDINNDGLVDLLIGSKEGPISYYKNNGTVNIPNFTLITDTFGNINNNPLVRQLIYDPSINDWKDTMMHDASGYTCLTSFKNNNSISVLALTNKTGNLRFYEPLNSSNPEGSYKENQNYFENIYSTAKQFNVGNRASICYVKPTKSDEDYLALGSIAGGISLFRRTGSASHSSLTNQTTLQVYPNPSSGKVVFISNKKIIKIEVYSISGVLIETTKRDFIDLSDMKPGIYIAKSTLDNSTIVTTKIIKSNL